MSTILRNLFAVLAILGVTSPAPAAVLFTETFSYLDGPLASYAHPANGVSGGLWTASFGFGTVNVSNGKANLLHRQQPDMRDFSGEDVRRGFSALAAGQTIYAGFDVSASGGDGRVDFAQLSWSTGPGFGIGLYIAPPISSGDFTFGIGHAISAPLASWPTGLVYGETYRTVLSYEYDTGVAKLWVNPLSQSSASVSFTGTALKHVSVVALVQGFTREYTGSAQQALDNLVVGTTFDDVLDIPAGPGDFNGDGDVDDADLAQWQGDFGMNSMSDADNDGDSDGADFLAWQQQFGHGPSNPPTNPVPEPASLTLAAALAAAFLTRHRKLARG
jgi:hypothetical protein